MFFINVHLCKSVLNSHIGLIRTASQNYDHYLLFVITFPDGKNMCTYITNLNTKN